MVRFAKVNSLALAFPGEVGPLGRLVKRRDACKFLGVTPKTLWKYEKDGRLHPLKNGANGWVMYEEAEILALLGSRFKQDRRVVLYCRVAGLGSPELGSREARLEAQENRMSEYCRARGIKVDQIISDIGSVFGDHELTGMSQLTELILRKKVSLLVIETEDRLGRWGMGKLFKNFLTWHGVEVHVAIRAKDRPEYVEEIKQDLTQVLMDSKRIIGS